MCIRDSNYTVAYGDNVNIGKGTVIVSGNGNYKGSVVMNFAIKALNINDLTDIDVSTPTDFVYNLSLIHIWLVHFGTLPRYRNC